MSQRVCLLLGDNLASNHFLRVCLIPLVLQVHEWNDDVARFVALCDLTNPHVIASRLLGVVFAEDLDFLLRVMLL